MAVRLVQVQGTGQLIELSRRLRAAGGPRLQQNFARRIRRAAEPLHRDLQQTMRGLEISSPGRTTRGGPSPTSRPLRATIAAAVKLSVRTTGNPGARIWIDRSQLPEDLQGMPRVLNDPSGRVRHPTFGNKSRGGWVNQFVSPTQWWTSTINSHQSRMRAEVERIVNDVRRDLGG